MPISQLKKVVKRRRAGARDTVKNHRKKAKSNSVQKNTEENAGANISHNESHARETSKPYKCTQSLGKAVKKTIKHFLFLNNVKM